MEVERKYGVSTTILFPLIGPGVADFESTPVTFAAGDTQLMKDEGAYVNATNTPAHRGNGTYSLVLTATEMQHARGMVTIIDQTDPKTWEDQAVLITTYGNASAEHAFDRDTAQQSVTVASMNANVLTAAAIATDAITAGKVAADAIGSSEFAQAAADKVWSTVARTLTANTNFNDLDAAAVRTAIGLATANLDTQLSALATSAALTIVDTVVDAIKAKTDQMIFTIANQLDVNVKSVKDSLIAGSGTAADPWRP